MEYVLIKKKYFLGKFLSLMMILVNSSNEFNEKI